MQYQIIIDDSKQQAKAVIALLKTLEGVSIQPIRAARGKKAAAKETFLKNFREGLQEVQQIKAGKLKAKPLNDLLNGH